MKPRRRLPPQTTTAPVSTTSPPHYLHAATVPGLASPYAIALGPEMNSHGSERVILTGTLTDANGSLPITITRELDQNFRIDIGGSKPKTLIAGNLPGTPSVTASLSSEDIALLETLIDDSPEGFLYGFLDGVPYRWLGLRFRTDDGTKPNYEGPWYDIYIRARKLTMLPGSPQHQKFTLLDSTTALYAFSRYTSASGGSQVQVQVSYSNWTTNSNGQQIPGTITRTENGAQVFSIQITSKANAPTQQDGLFNVGSSSQN